MNWLRSPLNPGNCILLFGVTAAIGGCTAPMKFENAESANTFEQDKYDCEVLLGYRGLAGETQLTDHLADYILFHQVKTEAYPERKG